MFEPELKMLCFRFTMSELVCITICITHNGSLSLSPTSSFLRKIQNIVFHLVVISEKSETNVPTISHEPVTAMFPSSDMLFIVVDNPIKPPTMRDETQY